MGFCLRKLACGMALFWFFAATVFAVPKMNVFEPVIVPGDGNYFKTGDSVNITFDVNAADVNGLSTYGAKAKLYYSKLKQGFETAITADLNLLSNCGSIDLNAARRTCSFVWTVPAIGDANYFIDINAFIFDLNSLAIADANSGTSSRSFFVDSNKPINSADYNKQWQATDANVQLFCADSGSGCTRINYRVDSDAGNGINMGAWQFADANKIGLLFNADGNFALDFNSVDRAGNVSDLNAVFVLVDKAGPKISVDANSGWQSVDANVKVNVTDSNQVKEVWIVRNGLAQLFTSNFSDLNAFFNADGNHALDVNATDYFGHTTVLDRKHVLVDKTAPSTPGTNSPSAGDGQITVSWGSATDNLSGIKSYDVFINGNFEATVNGVSFTKSGLSNGTSYAFKVRATDNASNASGFSSEVSASPQPAAGDSAVPLLDWVFPVDKQVVSGKVRLQVTAIDNDSGINKVQFYLNNTLLHTATAKINGFYSMDFDTTAYSNGEYTLKATGFDNAGNSSSLPLLMTIENKPIEEQGEKQEEEIVNADSNALAEALDQNAEKATVESTGLFSLQNSLPLTVVIVLVVVAIAALFLGGKGIGGETDYFEETGKRKGKWAFRR